MTDENLIGWDEDRTLDEIQLLLPLGWAFKLDPHPRGFWVASFLNVEKEVAWEDVNPAANLLLFDAYGWIKNHVRPTQPAKRTSNWAPRREIGLQAVNNEAIRRSRVPDPGDLDPKEVVAVYESRRHRHGR